MTVLLVVDTPPCGSESPCDASGEADAPMRRDEHVEVFLGGDGVRVATIHDLAEAVARCERTLSF